MSGRSPQAGRAGRASTEPQVAQGLGHSATIPNASVDPERCIGIVNPYGDLWTWDAFESCDDAERHLRDFWGDDADEMVPQFKLCMVRVDVVPESEPFDVPSVLKAKGETPP